MIARLAIENEWFFLEERICGNPAPWAAGILDVHAWNIVGFHAHAGTACGRSFMACAEIFATSIFASLSISAAFKSVSC